MEDSREENLRDVAKDDENKIKIHALRWDVYTRYKEELTKREFSVSIQHPKRGNIVWTCVKENIIKGKENCGDIGLHGFDYKLFEEDEVGGGSRGIRQVSLFYKYNQVVARRLGHADGKNESSGW